MSIFLQEISTPPSFRDARRALLYASPLQETIKEIRSLVHAVNVILDPKVEEALPMRIFEEEMGLVLDDLIVSAISEEVAKAGFQIDDRSPAEEYNAFFSTHRAEGSKLSKFVHDYPFLFQKCRLYLDNQLQSISKMTKFLMKQHNEIRTLLAQSDDHMGGTPGHVVDIEPTGGDPHCGGESVLKVRFVHGSVFWKPSGASGAQLWSAMLELMPLGGRLSLRAMKTVSAKEINSEHGTKSDAYWAENIEFAEIVPDSVSQYFERCGAFLACAQAFGISDCHYDNIIVDGRCPVLVDCETIFETRDSSTTPRQSVLNTMILQEPPRAFSPQSSQWVAAFQHPLRVPMDGQHIVVSADRTTHIATAARSEEKNSTGQPRHGDVVYPIRDHIAAVLKGYSAGWTALQAMHHKSEQFAELLLVAPSVQVRVIFRPTSYYGSVLRRLQQPDCLRSKETATKIIASLLGLHADRASQGHVHVSV